MSDHLHSHSMLNDVEIRLLSMKDVLPVSTLVKEEFYGKEPLSCHLNVPPDDAWKCGKPLYESCLNSKASYGAFDKASGLIVGVALVRFGTTRRPELNLKREYPLSIHQLFRIFRETNPNGLVAELKTSNYLDMIAIAIKKGYDKRGIGLQMAKRVLKRAQEMGCEYAAVMCTSAFSRKIAEQSGFKILREVVYEDYLDPLTREKVFRGVAKPHYASTLMFSKL